MDCDLIKDYILATTPKWKARLFAEYGNRTFLNLLEQEAPHLQVVEGFKKEEEKK